MQLIFNLVVGLSTLNTRSLLNHRNLDISEYVLGFGLFGVVYNGIYTLDGFEMEVAVKIQNENEVIKAAILEHFKGVKKREKIDHLLANIPKMVENERKMLVYLSRIRQHSNIVEFKGYGATDAGKNFLVYELCKINLIHVEPEFFTITKFLRVIIGISRGLGYLHSIGICHLDVKMDNVMLCDGENPKLIDFGISQTECDIDFMYPGNIEYMSPELKKGRDTQEGFFNGHQADVFALGILFQKLNGEVPHSLGILKNRFNSLLSGMLEANPNDRYTILEVNEELRKLNMKHLFT